MLRSAWVRAFVLGGCASIAATSVAAPSISARIAAVARLTVKPKTAEGTDLVRAGLGDAEAPVRAAAARVAHVMALVELIPAMRESVAREEDPDAAFEMAWALADLDTTDGSDRVLHEAMSKPSFTPVVVTAVVAGRGPRIVSMWEAAKAAFEARPDSVVGGLKAGLHRTAGSEIARLAIRDGLSSLAGALLVDDFTRVDASVALAGLAAPATAIRAAAYLLLADMSTASGPDDLERLMDPESLSERVSRHLFEAARGLSRRESLKEILAALKSDDKARRILMSRFLRTRGALRGLSPGDRGRLLDAVGIEKGAQEAFKLALDRPAVQTPGSAPAGESRVLRTLDRFPSEFVRGVLQESGCRGAERAFDGVDATYGPGGRATGVDPVRSASSAQGCAEAAHILGANSLASAGRSRVLAILPERPEFLACLAESPGKVAPPPRPSIDGPVEITEPKKVKNLSPNYPKDALANRVQGMVILDAIIAPSGCVASITVLKGLDLLMDLEAIEAVSGWKYTPALLNGAPVQVVMTVTVNFRLN
ncbi:MAG: energy transducer TonB [Vicinamibacteria bacterium]|nr:energy transducer TonB [Vicinamibacteria bacterium]